MHDGNGRFYLNVRTKFVVAYLLALLWTSLSIWLSLG